MILLPYPVTISSDTFSCIFFSGFGALTEIQNLLSSTAHDPARRESLIIAASNQFFTMIPSIHPHVIRDEDDFKSKVEAVLTPSSLVVLSRSIHLYLLDNPIYPAPFIFLPFAFMS